MGSRANLPRLAPASMAGIVLFAASLSVLVQGFAVAPPSPVVVDLRPGRAVHERATDGEVHSGQALVLSPKTWSYSHSPLALDRAAGDAVPRSQTFAECDQGCKASGGIHAVCVSEPGAEDRCKCDNGYIQSNPDPNAPMSTCIPVTQNLCEDFCKLRYSTEHSCADPQTLFCSCPPGRIPTIDESNGFDNGCTTASLKACTSRCQSTWMAGVHGMCADVETGACQCAEGYMWSRPDAGYITECVQVTEQRCTEACHSVSPQHVCADLKTLYCKCPDGYLGTLDESTGKVNGCAKATLEACTDLCQSKWNAGAHGICGDLKTVTCQCAEGYMWSEPTADHISECVPVTERLCTEGCRAVSSQHICADLKTLGCMCPKGYMETLDESTGKVNGCAKVTLEECTRKCQNKSLGGPHAVCASVDDQSCNCEPGYDWTDPSSEVATECIKVNTEGTSDSGTSQVQDSNQALQMPDSLTIKKPPSQTRRR